MASKQSNGRGVKARRSRGELLKGTGISGMLMFPMCASREPGEAVGSGAKPSKTFTTLTAASEATVKPAFPVTALPATPPVIETGASGDFHCSCGGGGLQRKNACTGLLLAAALLGRLLAAGHAEFPSATESGLGNGCADCIGEAAREFKSYRLRGGQRNRLVSSGPLILPLC